MTPTGIRKELVRIKNRVKKVLRWEKLGWVIDEIRLTHNLEDGFYSLGIYYEADQDEQTEDWTPIKVYIKKAVNASLAKFAKHQADVDYGEEETWNGKFYKWVFIRVYTKLKEEE